MFHLRGTIRQTRPGWKPTRTRLQAGMLVRTDHPFVRLQRARVQITNPAYPGGEVGITGRLGRQPHPLSPGLEPMGGQDVAHRLHADARHYARGNQLAHNFSAVPLGQRTPADIGAFTGDLDRVQRHLWGKKTPGVPVWAGRLSPGDGVVRNG